MFTKYSFLLAYVEQSRLNLEKNVYVRSFNLLPKYLNTILLFANVIPMNNQSSDDVRMEWEEDRMTARTISTICSPIQANKFGINEAFS